MGNKELKEYICVSCGDKVMATKFASQKTIQCSKCKEIKAPINDEILNKALEQNPIKERKKSTGSTKERPCIKCGNITTVSKFMSDTKVLCSNCKGESSHKIIDIPDIDVDISKLDRSQILPIEEYEVNDGIISNKKLVSVVCPACGHEYMKPLRILDWSSFGLIISYQCPECLLTMTLSEQSRRMHSKYNMGKSFNYSGEEIRELAVSNIEHSRMANIILELIKQLEDNNIKLDEKIKPPYKYLQEKPVPTGYKIPRDDIWIKIINNILNTLKNTDRQGSNIDLPEGSRYITLSDTLCKSIENKLIKLLKGDYNETDIRN